MDLSFFLKRRTQFIRTYYTEGRRPFDEIKAKIEAEVEPYVPPPFDPDYGNDEPYFLEEWMDADLSIEVLGLSCVSLLSESLKIFFKETERQFGYQPSEELKRKTFKKHGFVSGYRECLSSVLGTDWSDCPVRFEVIEQIVLVRNLGQHGGSLTDFRVIHDDQTTSKHTSLFFVGERYRNSENSIDEQFRWFSPPYVEVTSQNLFEAIAEVEKLAVWISEREGLAYKWRQQRQSRE